MKHNVELENIQLANVVIKDSKTGLLANKRLLVLKGGFLYYYSNVPKVFKGDLKVLQNNSENIPKCSIEISNIMNIKGDFRTPLQFEIQFQAKNMMEKTDIRKTVTLEEFNFAPKNTTQIIKWKFTCQSKEIRDRWIESLKNLKEYYIKEKVNIQKFFKSINAENNQQSQILSPRRSVKIPWKSQAEEKKFEEEKNRQNQIQQQKRKKRMEQQEKLQQQKKKKLQQAVRLQKQKDREKEKEERKKKEEQRKFIEQEQKRKLQEQMKKQRQQEERINKQLLEIEREEKEKQEKRLIPQKNLNEQESIKHDFDEKQRDLGNKLSRLQLKETFKQQYIRDSPRYRSTSQQRQNRVEQTRSPFNLVSRLFTGTFKEKIETQVQYYLRLSQFRDKAASYFEQIVNELSIQQSQRRFVIPQNKVLEIEDIRFKVATSSTRNIIIGHQHKFYYDQSEIKAIKREFQMYDLIQTKINKQIKEGRHMKIRVPITCYLEFRGIVGLAYKINQSESSASKYDDNHDVVNNCSKIQINPSEFLVKKLNDNDQIYVLYQRKAQKIQKNHSLTFPTPLTSQFLEIAEKERCSTSISNLKKYLQKMRFLEMNPENEEIIYGLENALFCKYIRKIYRSAQGEIDQVNFWNLIIKRDKSILSMLKDIGCQGIPQYKGILFNYVAYYFGIQFEFVNPKQPFSSQFPISAAHISPLTKIYKTKTLELQEAMNNFEKYMKQDKLALAKQSSQLKKRIYDSKFEQRQSVKTILERAQMYYGENDVIESIKQCKKALQMLSQFDVNKFSAYTILLKNYEYSESDMVSIFKSWIELTFSIFGENHHSLITFYCIMAYFFGNKKQNAQAGHKLYSLALSLCKKLYKKDNLQVADIYLDISKMYKLNNKLVEALEYLQKSKEIHKKIESNTVNYAKMLVYSAHLNYSRKQLVTAESQIQQAISLLQSRLSQKRQLIQAYKIAEFIYGQEKRLTERDNIIEKMWKQGEANIKYLKLSIEICFRNYIKKLKKQELSNFETFLLGFQYRKEEQSIGAAFLQDLKKGYRTIVQLFDDMFETLISNSQNRPNIQFHTLKKAFEHSINIMDQFYVNTLVESLK